VYTNTAGGGGTLGYTTSTPPVGGGTGIGSAGDRCVILWSTIGSPCPSPGIYCLGRTLTHEAGHYFGLFHPFDNGCGTSATCYTTGDRICDTNPDSAPHFNCVVATSCSPAVPAPITNYMEYTNDSCMNNFTPEQVRRMRCDIDNYRTVLPIRVPIFPGNFTGTPNTLTNNIAVNGTTVIDSDGSQPGFSDGAGENGPPSTLYAGVPFLEPGDEVAYKINHPGGALKLTLTGLTSDVDLMLINSTGTPAGTIASSVLFGTANEKIITNAAAGTYYAVVDTGVVSGYAVYGSPFTIRYSRCVADIDNTGVVDVNDLLAVVSTWGACAGGCPPSCLGDISPVGGNCVVDVNDLLTVVSHWGPCP
jgi:hypothetical protein